MELPKRKIDEVRTRLIREKTIREIYVEGIFDRDLYRWALKQLDIKDVRVYPISTLDVSDEILLEQGLTSGNRQRVIAAAQLLEDDQSVHKQVLFLIDTDFDLLLGRALYKPPLAGTYGTSAELILWRKEVLQKFFTMALACDQSEMVADELMAYVEPIAKAVSLFRAAKDFLGENWTIIDIADTFGKGKEFSFEEYCGKVADKNAARHQMAEKLPGAVSHIKSLADKLDKTQILHGHDLFSALGKKLRIDGYTQKFLADFNELSRIVMASLEWGFVHEDKTIQMLRAKFKEQTI